MALPKETRDRIVAEAAAKTGFKDDEDSTPISKGHYYGYIAGATAESERAQVLVDALEQVLALAPIWEYQPPVKPEHEGEAWAMSEMKRKADNALQQFKDGKGKERPCPHCGKELSRDRNLCCRECGKEVENG